jgi:hypothetical protein
MLPATTERVRQNTPDEYNRAIREQTEANVRRFAAAGPVSIEARLEELDREWDIERLLEANAATLALVGATLGLTVDRRWNLLPIAVTGFLLQHALQGWCPPVPLFRRLGVRTAAEIAEERHALKALRGDYDGIETAGAPDRAQIHSALQAARA